MHIMQENHAIKAQLNQLTDLVCQLIQQLVPATQATQQATYARNPHSELLPAKEQFPSTQPLAFPLPLGPSPEKLFQRNHQAASWQCTPALLCKPQHLNTVPPCQQHLPQ